MDRTASLTAGLRTLLLAGGIPAIQIGPMVDTVEDTVAITPYPLDDDLETGVVLQAVQVHVRGTLTGGVLPVLDRQDQILTVVGNFRNQMVGGIHVTLAWRQMSVPLGPDGRGRPEVRDTYYLRTDRLGRAG